MIIRLNAGNDNNGNPRRVFVRFDNSGNIRAAYDEEYKGLHAVPKRYYKMAVNACTFDTTVSEYKALLKEYGA